MSDSGVGPDLVRVFDRAQRLGLIGASTSPRLELAHSEGLARQLGLLEKISCLDLGSGAGLPGLVLAKLWPNTFWTLLDRRKKCGDFLLWAIEALKLSESVEVLQQNAREALRSRAGSIDLLVARAFGRPLATAELAVGFLRKGGRLIVTEPAIREPNRWPRPKVERTGLTLVARHEGPPAFVEFRKLS